MYRCFYCQSNQVLSCKPQTEGLIPPPPPFAHHNVSDQTSLIDVEARISEILSVMSGVLFAVWLLNTAQSTYLGLRNLHDQGKSG